MDGIKLKAKQSVLQNLIELMEEKELGQLKSKSPKFSKPMESEADASSIADELKSKLMSNEEEVSPVMVGADESEVENPEDDEDLEKLKEMYSRLK